MTDIRPELSKSNKYWIDRHRYYELKHFCLQYPLWKLYSQEIDGLKTGKIPGEIFGKTISNPVLWAVGKREEYLTKILMVEEAAKLASPELSDYILKAVISGLAYENLHLVHGLPCGREYWYELYRKFFYILSDSRK